MAIFPHLYTRDLNPGPRTVVRVITIVERGLAGFLDLGPWTVAFCPPSVSRGDHSWCYIGEQWISNDIKKKHCTLLLAVKSQ